jgi:hypothetical protein
MFEREMIPRPKRRSADEHQQATNALLWRDMAPEQTAESGMRATPAAAHSIGNIAIEPPQLSVGPAGGTVPTNISDRIAAKQGGGAPLDGATRARMETDLGHHFADVRIHADDESDALNRRVGANAFTLGSDIFLGREATSAGAYGGDEMLAHELTHVVQQQGTTPGGPLTVGAVDDPQEHEASAVASAVSAGSSTRVPSAVPSAQTAIAPTRVQRDAKAGKGKAPKPTVESLAQDVGTLKEEVAILKEQNTALQKSQTAMQKREKALQLDSEWRAKFGQVMASRKQAVWRITGGIDAANKGFQDAQVAQAQADQMWTQVIGLGASVLFAGGFEWLFSGALGKLGMSTTTLEERVGALESEIHVPNMPQAAGTVGIPGQLMGGGGLTIESLVETLENPANSAFGGYMTNIRSTEVANQDAQQGQVPAITGGGGGAMAYLTQQSEALEKHAGSIEGAFGKRADEMKALTDDQWASFDVDAQAKNYQDLHDALEKSGKGVDDLRTPEQIATIIECHLWAAWIQNKHLETLKDNVTWDPDDPRNQEGYVEDPNEISNFGNAINQRLIDLGVEAAAGTGLYTHWWEMNADGWEAKIMDWARTYKRGVSKN